MSKLFPKSLASNLRNTMDEMIKLNGQDVTLYHATVVEDDLGDSETITYGSGISTTVLIHWSPEIRRLKSLGLYVEGAPLPILAYFKYADRPEVRDYIKLEYQYPVTDENSVSSKTNKFQVVDIKIRGHDAEALSVYVIAPKRS